MIGHVSIGVKNLNRSALFYDAVLGALGYVRLWSGETVLGYGEATGGEELNLFEVADPIPPGQGCHLAFNAPNTKAVDHFHAAALEHGGSDEGQPGLRPDYGPTYYAAFVRDPDGYKLEAVKQ